MEQFLKETYYCDFGNPELKKVAQDLVAKYTNQTELARAIFILCGITLRIV